MALMFYVVMFLLCSVVGIVNGLMIVIAIVNVRIQSSMHTWYSCDSQYFPCWTGIPEQGRRKQFGFGTAKWDTSTAEGSV